MSFDLAGLLQRNTQNTLSGLSSSASAGRTDMSSKTAEGAQAGSLTVGSAISGQVIKVEGDTVYVKLPSEVLTAKLQEGVNLQTGQSVTFAVSGISDKQITLQALFQNSAQTQVLGKALEQAGIAQTADSLSMVDAMMREGMSVDKNSLWQMYRQVLDHPQTTGENIVLMNRLQIPVNDLTAAQFQNLQNANGQLAQAANTLTDSLYAEFTDMAVQSPQEAAAFMKELVLLLGESSQTEAGQVGALPLEGQEVPGDVQPADGNQQPAAGNSTGQTEAAGDPVAGQPAGGQTAENGVDARLAFDGQVQTETDGRQVQAEADGGRLQGSNAEKLSTDGQVEQMKENFLLKPEMVADKEEVEQFFTKLREQVSRLAQTVSEAGKAQTQLFTQTNQLRENLDFLHQLSQTMQYVQLPLRMAGQETTGDLYVYANKKGLTKEDSISAFLHLDMEHLGPVDVYVAMQNRKVNTHFYLQDDAMIDFIQAHIHLLNERLEQKGYQMQTEVSQKDTPSKVTEPKQAVALSYDPDDDAPKVVATGKGALAEKIIEEAKQAKVPVHKDSKLADTLSRLEIGELIPPELYEVVAEILVFVDQMDRIRAKMEQANKKK